MTAALTEAECIAALANELKCAICLSLMKPPVARLRCCHSFCRSCLQEGLRRAPCCPLCKASATRRDVCGDAKLDKAVALFTALDAENLYLTQAPVSYGALPEAAPPREQEGGQDGVQPAQLDVQADAQQVPEAVAAEASLAAAALQVPVVLRPKIKTKRLLMPKGMCRRPQPEESFSTGALKRVADPEEASGQDDSLKRQKKPTTEHPPGMRGTPTPRTELSAPEPEVPCQQWGSAKRKWVFLLSGLTATEKEQLQQLANVCGAKLTSKVGSAVTHIICGRDKQSLAKRTLKYLLGILHYKWIVHPSWVDACLRANAPEAEEDHEVIGDSSGGRGGPQLARLQAGLKLLKGWEVYCQGSFDKKGGHEEMAKAAGARLLRRLPPPAETLQALRDNPDDDSLIQAAPRTIVLVEGEQGASCRRPAPDWDGVCIVTSWLSDSVANFTLQPFTPYLAELS